MTFWDGLGLGLLLAWVWDRYGRDIETVDDDPTERPIMCPSCRRVH